jgi:hypothetical protein
MGWHRVILAGIRGQENGGSGLVKRPRAPYSIRSFGLRRGCGLPLQVAGFIKAAALESLGVVDHVAATGSRGSAG